MIQFIPVKDEKGYKKRTLWTFVPLFLYGALRIDFGLDYDLYEANFNSIKLYGIDSIGSHQEFGYRFLCSLLPSFRVLLILDSFLICWAYYTLFYKLVPKKYTWLAVILFFLSGKTTVFFMYSGIRNGISIAIFILAFTYMVDRKWIHFALFTATAAMIHTSAAFIMPIAFLIANRRDIEIRVLAIWLGIMLFFMFSSLGDFVMELFDYMNLVTDRYDEYVEELSETVDNRGFSASSAALLQALLVGGMMLRMKIEERKNPLYKLLLFYLFCGTLGNLNYRISSFFIFFSILAIVRLYYLCKDSLLKVALVVVALFVSSYDFLQALGDLSKSFGNSIWFFNII